MTDNFEVTLDNCHKEPIHIPGSIQSHGYLLVVDPATMTLSCVSENVTGLCGAGLSDCIGKSLADVVDADYCAIINNHGQSEKFQLKFQIRIGDEFARIIRPGILAYIRHCKKSCLVI